jgi:hypothetical protein
MKTDRLKPVPLKVAINPPKDYVCRVPIFRGFRHELIKFVAFGPTVLADEEILHGLLIRGEI